MELEKILAISAIFITTGLIALVSTIAVTDVQTKPQAIMQEHESPKSISQLKNPEISKTISNQEYLKFPQKESQCNGNAQCIDGFVTRVIDGDTIVVGDKSIRFALVNTPEWGDYDYSRARSFVEMICPVGSKVVVDEDDGQTDRSFGRIIGKIYCDGLVLNEEILEVGHAIILTEFCPVSEFAQESWAKKHGC